jgi:DNA primase
MITWITDEPELYPKIRKYISATDFTEPLYRTVAEKLFADLDEGKFNPAAVISMFEDEDEQREAASLFNTNLPSLDTKQERENALHDIIMAVKKNSYEYYTANLGADVNAINKVIEGKKALEELAGTHISID